MHFFIILFLCLKILPFQTRKSLDYSYWVLCVKICKYSYYLLSEGKQFISKVYKFFNKNRYTNNKKGFTVKPDFLFLWSWRSHKNIKF